MAVATAAADRPAAATGRPVVDPADWTGAELRSRTDWRFEATPSGRPPIWSTWRGPRPPGWTATRTGC